MEASQEEVLRIADFWNFPDRYSVVDAMWQGHKGASLGAFPENMCPPLAIFITSNDEPVAFLSCYQAVGIGVAIMDLVCTKPGLSLAQSKRALLFGADAILKALQANDYGVCIAYPTEAVGSVLSRHGWQDHGMKAQLMTATNN